MFNVDYLELYLKYKNNPELVDLIRHCEDLEKLNNQYEYSPEEYAEIIDERDEAVKNYDDQLDICQNMEDIIYEMKENLEYIVSKKYIPEADADIQREIEKQIEEAEKILDA